MALNRFQAFGAHLAVSCLIAASTAAIVFLLWYPGPLASASGVTAIFLLLLGVDVAIGPLITLVVFDRRKKELRRDMVVVALLQTAALLYGVHTVFAARPVYYVFNVDRFDAVFANDLTKDKMRTVTNQEFARIPVWGPKVIAARPSQDSKVRQEIMLNAAVGGDDLPQLPQFYVSYAELSASAGKRAFPIEMLKAFNPGQEATIDQLLKDHAANPHGIAFLPVRGKTADFVAVLERDTARVLEFVSLRPWNS